MKAKCVPIIRVVSCSDESFAEAKNLLKTSEPEFRFGVFLEGAGQEFDSWETRRHNETPPDWVILALEGIFRTHNRSRHK